MKKFLFMLVFAFVALAASAQTGRVISLPVDTLMGAETITLTPIAVTGTYESMVITVLCTQTGGTSDGSVTLLGSLDGTNYTALNGTSGAINVSPLNLVNDTTQNKMTIINTAVLAWQLKPGFRFYKLTASGTAGDSTKLSAKYTLK